MISYKYLVRICEGNKQLARSTQAFLKSRNVLANRECKNKIRPLIKDAENDILQRLRSNTISQWEVNNLNNILANIMNVVERLDNEFSVQQQISNIILGDHASKFIGKNLRAINSPIQIGSPLLTDETLQAITILDDFFINNYTNDMRKILTGEISLGIINNKTINEVTQSIQGKFESSMMSYARARRIANTEMLRASSASQNISAQQAFIIDPTLKKAWINSHRPEARITHIQVESQTTANPIPVDQEFNVDGEKAMFPRDPKLSAKNTVDCGCTFVILSPQTEKAGFDIKKVVKKANNK